jgi:hypothetical protein
MFLFAFVFLLRFLFFSSQQHSSLPARTAAMNNNHESWKTKFANLAFLEKLNDGVAVPCTLTVLTSGVSGTFVSPELRKIANAGLLPSQRLQIEECGFRVEEAEPGRDNNWFVVVCLSESGVSSPSSETKCSVPGTAAAIQQLASKEFVIAIRPSTIVHAM